MVIRLPNWLGDVVMSLPIIRALREARPDMYFIISGRSIFKSLFSHLTFVSNMFHLILETGLLHLRSYFRLEIHTLSATFFSLIR